MVGEHGSCAGCGRGVGQGEGGGSEAASEWVHGMGSVRCRYFLPPWLALRHHVVLKRLCEDCTAPMGARPSSNC